MATSTIEPADTLPALATDDRLAFRVAASALADDVRRLVLQERYQPFKPRLYSLIGYLIAQSMRTCARDESNIRYVIKQFGGGDIEHIAEYSHLPADELPAILAAM
ncbi:MAG TPA: hypothetical protein VF525_08075 [Pyrinomonadaceae bacterium]|jgi:hypothetical protein